MRTIFEEHADFFDEMAESLTVVALQGLRRFGRGVVLLHFHELERARQWPGAPIPVRFQPDMSQCRDDRLLAAVEAYDPKTEMLVVVGWVRGEHGGRYDVCRMRVVRQPRTTAGVA
jgi:hypothetical protein